MKQLRSRFTLFLRLLLCVGACLGIFFCTPALADTAPAPSATPDAANGAAEAPESSRPTAAEAAQLLRDEGEQSARYALCLLAGIDGAALPPLYVPGPGPMVLPGETLARGEKYNLYGKVRTTSPITEVAARFIKHTANGDRVAYEQAVAFSPEAAVLEYNLRDDSVPLRGRSLNRLVNFGNLGAGSFTMELMVKTVADPAGTAFFSVAFTVERQKFIQLTQNRISSNSYYRLMEFFDGDAAQFLFRYEHLSGARIRIEESWRAQYLATSDFGLVHAKAVPYFNRAHELAETTYVRVSGTNGDSRVIPVIKLIKNISGAYNPRLQISQHLISHHSFGTVIDINTEMASNSQTRNNKALIRDEVMNHLVYNGIQTADDGQKYHDFTYDGKYRKRFKTVPESIINYLLFELAFYPAGFNWGYYFDDAADGMHYTLTELDRAIHTDPVEGLCKVFEYIA